MLTDLDWKYVILSLQEMDISEMMPKIFAIAKSLEKPEVELRRFWEARNKFRWLTGFDPEEDVGRYKIIRTPKDREIADNWKELCYKQKFANFVAFERYHQNLKPLPSLDEVEVARVSFYERQMNALKAELYKAKLKHLKPMLDALEPKKG